MEIDPSKVVTGTVGYCHSGGCVGIAAVGPHAVAMVDTKEESSPAIVFTDEQFAAFVADQLRRRESGGA